MFVSKIVSARSGAFFRDCLFFKVTFLGVSIFFGFIFCIRHLISVLNCLKHSTVGLEIINIHLKYFLVFRVIDCLTIPTRDGVQPFWINHLWLTNEDGVHSTKTHDFLRKTGMACSPAFHFIQLNYLLFSFSSFESTYLHCFLSLLCKKQKKVMYGSHLRREECFVYPHFTFFMFFVCKFVHDFYINKVIGVSYKV